MLELLQYPFFLNALIGVIIISVASAMIGTYVVTRRMVFLAGGITHTCFGGLGLGYFLGLNPVWMGALFGIGGALGSEMLSRHGRVRSDSAVAVMWALGMGLGVLFVFLTDGFVPELTSFLFGNVLTITSSDLLTFGIFTLVTLLIYITFYRLIIGVSFDADFARTRHLPVNLVETVMMIIVAVGVVLTIRLIGIMLLMSIISIPQITAEIFVKNYKQMMILSGVVSIIGSVSGLFFAYAVGVPASAGIILMLSLIYIISLLFKVISRKYRIAAKH
jgi:zinc transport system permease protein